MPCGTSSATTTNPYSEATTRWFSLRRSEVKSVVSYETVNAGMAGRPFRPIWAGAGGESDATQRATLGLVDVEYVIAAEVQLTAKGRGDGERLDEYTDQFRKRASKGKCVHRPALGCREFAADFDRVDDPAAVPIPGQPLSDDLGLMLYDVFDPDRRATGRFAPVQPLFFPATVANGVLDCHPDRVRLYRPGGP